MRHETSLSKSQLEYFLEGISRALSTGARRGTYKVMHTAYALAPVKPCASGYSPGVRSPSKSQKATSATRKRRISWVAHGFHSARCVLPCGQQNAYFTTTCARLHLTVSCSSWLGLSCVSKRRGDAMQSLSAAAASWKPSAAKARRRRAEHARVLPALLVRHRRGSAHRRSTPRGRVGCGRRSSSAAHQAQRQGQRQSQGQRQRQ
eukprot:scaffold114352_cov78-Phaeocystis_antarctica.AAC.2